MKKLSTILNNIKFDVQQEHLLQQMLRNSQNILKDKENFYLLAESEKLYIHIYKNVNKDLIDSYDLLFQCKNSLSGVVFYEFNTKNIIIFPDATLITSYDEHIDFILDNITDKSWYTSHLKKDIDILKELLNKNSNVMESYNECYSEERMRHIFESSFSLSSFDNSIN